VRIKRVVGEFSSDDARAKQLPNNKTAPTIKINLVIPSLLKSRISPTPNRVPHNGKVTEEIFFKRGDINLTPS
jgi:hypothetical protein